MIKIVLIHLVLIVTYCETQTLRKMECVVWHDIRLTVFSGVCGSDGRTYSDINILKCVQGTEYGKQVNLQLSHEGTCFGELTWKQINLTILPFVIVSRF